MKPFAKSCEQNKAVILEQLQWLLSEARTVLEIGSGTGQHAVYFAKHLPHLSWQCSDQAEYLDGIRMWLDDENLLNTPSPIALNVSQDSWPERKYDAIFSANAVHIMSWENVVDFMNKSSSVISNDGLLILYGPFKYYGKYTSDSNERFDQWLKNQDPESGIKDFESLDQLAKDAKLTLQRDIEMPANNRILCWKKSI